MQNDNRTEFDHAAAWHAAAWPAYQQLSTPVLNLLARVAVRAADLTQLRDCSMPWPDGDVRTPETLYAEFAAIGSADLALAACVIYDVGHWRPSDAPAESRLPGAEHGSHWKFTHYADQVLRERFGLPARETNGRDHGFGLAILEGAIRVTYASRDAWYWEIVAPATEDGIAHARALISDARSGMRARPRDEDGRVWQWFQTLRESSRTAPIWPDAWRPLMETDRYMVTRHEMERRQLQRRPAPDFAKLRAGLVAKHARQQAAADCELAGMLWILDRQEPIDNVIYYTHADRFCWGWRHPLAPEDVARVLDFISEFPYPYTIKRTDGAPLEGD